MGKLKYVGDFTYDFCGIETSIVSDFEPIPLRIMGEGYYPSLS